MKSHSDHFDLPLQDVETILETDDELEKVRQQLEFDQPEYMAEDQIHETF